MTRNAPPSIGSALGLLALVACGDPSGPEPTGSFSSSASSVSAASDTWVAQANMPRRLYCCTAAAARTAGGRSVLYVMGGRAITGEVVAAVHAYDVATNSWSIKAPMPTPLNATNGAALIQDKIYVSGGIGTRGNARATLFRYDPATNSWTARANMPTDTEGGVTAVINNELYVLTGCGDGAECDQGVIPMVFYRYSPVTDAWTTLPNPPLTVRPRKAAVFQGKLYTFGGDNRRQIRVFDPATNRWSSRPAIPLEHAPRAQSQRPVVLGGKVYLVGGIEILPDDTYRPLPTSVYDPSTGTWVFKAAMPVGQTTLSADRVVVGAQSRIQVLTSEINAESLHRNWQYIP